MSRGTGDEGMTLTETKVVALLMAAGPLTARQVAYALWPDSPGWAKRTKMHRGRNGAVGGAMPMRAGRILNAMATKNMVQRADGLVHENRWQVRETA
jgi:hypothetical protein